MFSAPTASVFTRIFGFLRIYLTYFFHILADCISEHFYELNGVDDRPDFYNFRNLLLESLLSASHVKFTSECFAVKLFLKFIKFDFLLHTVLIRFYGQIVIIYSYL